METDRGTFHKALLFHMLNAEPRRRPRRMGRWIILTFVALIGTLLLMQLLGWM